MDLSFTDAEEAFRAEARAWLEANVPGRPLPSGDTREGFAAHLEWERQLFDGRLGGRVVAGRVRRPRRVAVGVADLRGGVLPGRRAPAGHPERHLPAGADDVRVRHRGAAGRASCPAWRRPRTCGARAGPSPTPAATSPASPAGPCATTRPAAGGYRPEDVDHPRRVLHPPVRAVPHRPRGRAPPRPDLLPRARSTPPA